MIASHGLADPWFDSKEPNTGLGFEIVVATEDEVPDDPIRVMGSWIFGLAQSLILGAISDTHFHTRYKNYGMFLFGILISEHRFEFHDDWECYDGRIGFLMGLPMRGRSMSYSTEFGDVDIVTGKLLTPLEYEYGAKYGEQGFQDLADAFSEQRSEHLSSLKRPSVIKAG